jgi:ADP-ribose pyrophosphatase YjhB (NUDIX family)
MSDPGAIRVLAIVLFRAGDAILVAGGRDPVTGAEYFRPLGGGVEFGESAEEAVRREMREELGAEIEAVTRVGVLENRFTYEGRARHEIVFVLDARFADPALAGRAELPVLEGGWTPARWVPLDTFRSGAARLVPEALLALLALLDGAGA